MLGEIAKDRHLRAKVGRFRSESPYGGITLPVAIRTLRDLIEEHTEFNEAFSLHPEQRVAALASILDYFDIFDYRPKPFARRLDTSGAEIGISGVGIVKFSVFGEDTGDYVTAGHEVYLEYPHRLPKLRVTLFPQHIREMLSATVTPFDNERIRLDNLALNRVMEQVSSAAYRGRLDEWHDKTGEIGTLISLANHAADNIGYFPR